MENLYRLSVLSPDDTRHHVERWAVELLRDSEGTPDRFASLDEIREKLMPMVVAAELPELAASRIVTQPVIEGLAVTYVLDGDRTIAYVPKRRSTAGTSRSTNCTNWRSKTSSAAASRFKPMPRKTRTAT